MDRMLIVEVKGQAGTGKTTVALLIAQTLKDHGFEVQEVQDEPLTPEALRPERQAQRLAGLKGLVGVTVKTVQSSRVSSLRPASFEVVEASASDTLDREALEKRLAMQVKL